MGPDTCAVSSPQIQTLGPSQSNAALGALTPGTTFTEVPEVKEPETGTTGSVAWTFLTQQKMEFLTPGMWFTPKPQE